MKRHLLEQLVDAARLAEKCRQEKIQAVREQNYEKASDRRTGEKNYLGMVDVLIDELADEQREDQGAE